MNRSVVRYSRAGLPIAALMALAACGVDPPATSSASSASPQAANAPVTGLKPTPATGLVMAEANAPAIKCNIETIGGQGMDGVYPEVNESATVGIAGWYFAPDAAAATGDAPGVDAQAAAATTTDAPAADAATAATAATDSAGTASSTAEAPTPAAAATGLQLVFAMEGGAKFWSVPITATGDRPDVAQYLSLPASARSGFALDLNLTELPPANYSVYIANSTGAAESVCGLGRGFVIK